MVPCLSKVAWKQIRLEVGVKRILNYSLYNEERVWISVAGGDVHIEQYLIFFKLRNLCYRDTAATKTVDRCPLLN